MQPAHPAPSPVDHSRPSPPQQRSGEHSPQLTRRRVTTTCTATDLSIPDSRVLPPVGGNVVPAYRPGRRVRVSRRQWARRQPGWARGGLASRLVAALQAEVARSSSWSCIQRTWHESMPNPSTHRAHPVSLGLAQPRTGPRSRRTSARRPRVRTPTGPACVRSSPVSRSPGRPNRSRCGRWPPSGPTAGRRACHRVAASWKRALKAGTARTPLTGPSGAGCVELRREPEFVLCSTALGQAPACGSGELGTGHHP